MGNGDHGRLALGWMGEERAATWYRDHGYTVVARNWRTAQGEIDLICARAGLLVISEVKARRRATHGQPFEAVTAAKQRRLRRLSVAYLRSQRTTYDQVRFDVVSILGLSLEVIEGAF
jgi:putative endonuclease